MTARRLAQPRNPNIKAFEKCPICGGELGERLYGPDVVKKFEEVRGKLETPGDCRVPAHRPNLRSRVGV